MVKLRMEIACAAALVAAASVASCGPTGEPPPRVTEAKPPQTANEASRTGGAPRGETSTHAEKPDPLRPMSPREESVAMPKAGQANDHSNPAAQPVPTPPSGSTR